MNAQRREPRGTTRRRGIAAMLAMLFLVLISTLAVGFYASTATSAQLVHNEAKAGLALLAAESGMDFTRYQLDLSDIPYNTTPDNLFAELVKDLKYQLDGTPNLGGTQIYASAEQVRIPAGINDFVTLDPATGMAFRATIDNLGQKVRVTVVGKNGNTTSTLVPGSARGVRLEYGLAQKAAQIFDYGVASRGKVVTAGSARIRGATDPKKGSIISTTLSDPTPVDIRGSEVSGDISIVNPVGNVFIAAGASVGGTNDPTKIRNEHVHKGVVEPPFPTIDTDVFKPYAVNPWPGDSVAVYENVIVPANTNPTFSGNVQIKGVMYVEAPNKLTFRGGTDIQGLIAVQNSPVGNPSTNILDFAGSVTVRGVGSLPESYGDLRKLTGSVILAPNFHTRFTGSFGEIRGHVITGKATFDGSASGTIYGSIVNLMDTQMLVKGSSEIVIASTGTTDYPAGVYFSSHYTPLKDTYREIKAGE